MKRTKADLWVASHDAVLHGDADGPFVGKSKFGRYGG
jgi:hypothetical protein